MPKLISLHNQHIAVEKGTELEPDTSADGEPVVHEIWTLIFNDRSYGDQIRISFRKDVRDQVVKDLMGGVILPGTI